MALEKGRPLSEGVNKPSWLTPLLLTACEEGTNKHTLHHLGQLHGNMGIEGGSVFLNWWWPRRTWDSHTKTRSKVGRWTKPLLTAICLNFINGKITQGVNIKTNMRICCSYVTAYSIIILPQRSPRIYTVRMTKTQFGLVLSYWCTIRF